VTKPNPEMILMPFNRPIRSSWCAALLGVTGLLTGGCATRSPQIVKEVAPVATSIIWRIEEGDMVRTRVFRNPELDAEATVSPNGTAFFPGLGRVTITGMTLDSLESMLNARYATLIREPAVQVTMARDVTLYGQVRSPGVYAADPGMTLLALVAKAGGFAGQETSVAVTLRTADGRRLALPGEARLGTIDLHRRDAIFMSSENFLSRNAASIAATQILVTTLTAALGLVLIVTR
jgi:protein involved in polysaccharide export with SLBB domain